MGKFVSRIGGMAVLVVASAIMGATLAGCSVTTHQIVSSTDSCASCHSEVPATYDVADSEVSVTQTCGTTITVETSQSEVIACKPLYVSESGKDYVPLRKQTARVDDGKATLELEEGLWLIAIDKGDSSKSVFIYVDASAENATISL